MPVPTVNDEVPFFNRLVHPNAIGLGIASPRDYGNEYDTYRELLRDTLPKHFVANLICFIAKFSQC